MRALGMRERERGWRRVVWWVTRLGCRCDCRVRSGGGGPQTTAGMPDDAGVSAGATPTSHLEPTKPIPIHDFSWLFVITHAISEQSANAQRTRTQCRVARAPVRERKPHNTSRLSADSRTRAGGETGQLRYYVLYSRLRAVERPSAQGAISSFTAASTPGGIHLWFRCW